MIGFDKSEWEEAVDLAVSIIEVFEASSDCQTLLSSGSLARLEQSFLSGFDRQ